MKKIEESFESIMFKSRWLLAPFFFGLLIAIAALLVKFAKELFHLMSGPGGRRPSSAYSL